MRRATSNLFLTLMVTFLLAGCHSIYNIGASKRNNQFDKTSNSYRIYIRWGEYEKAEAFIKMREGIPSKLDLDHLNQIHVTSYDVIKEYVSLDEEKFPKEIVEDVEIEFYPESTLTVKNLRHQQVWWYDVEEERWYLDTDLPDFRPAD